MSVKVSCCPPNAEKYLAASYATNGEQRSLPSGLEFYSSGSTSLGKAIILIPDVYGWNGGRIRNIADMLAEAGYYAVIPKLLVPAMEGGTDGDGLYPSFDFATEFSKFPPYISQFTWEGVLGAHVNDVTSYLKESGITKIAFLGFCWGGLLVANGLTAPTANEFLCGAIAHPSITLENMIFLRDTQLLIDRIEKPVLLMPAKGDPDEYRVGGAYFETIKAKCPTSDTMDFNQVNHGFLVRGDIDTDPIVKEAVDAALAKTFSFFAAHFNQ